MTEVLLNTITNNDNLQMQAQCDETFHTRAHKEEQKLVKDLLSVAVAVGGAKLTTQQEENEFYIQPPNDSGDQGGDGGKYDIDNNFSIIAIIGEVLVQQAKVTSNTWSTFWQEASFAMNQSVKMAPLIAEAITNTFEQQANQSEAEGSMARNNAILSGFMFGGAVVWGGIDYFKELKGETDSGVDGDIPVPEDEEEPLTQEDELGGINGKEKISDDEEDDDEMEFISTEESDVKNEKNLLKKTEDEDAPGATKLKNSGKSVWGKVSTYAKFPFKSLEKSVVKMQAIQMMYTIGSQSNECVIKDKIAGIQKETGKYEAASKEMEQFTQYWNQFFQRTEDIRSGSQQFIDLLMSVYKSLVETNTSTIQAMFQG